MVPKPTTDLNDLQEVVLPNGTRIVWGLVEATHSLLLDQETVHALVMHFTLAGSITVRMEKLNQLIDIQANEHNLLYPAGGNFRLHAGLTQACQFLHIYLASDFFGQPLLQDSPTLQQLAESIRAWQPVCLIPDNLPITPDMHTVLAQIIKCPLTCSLKRLFLEAKVLELLTLQLVHYEQYVSGPTLAALSSDYPKLVEARQLLEARFANPPTLPQLSRLIGLNEYKLKKGFKAAFGETIHNWVLNYRLDQAYQLLQSRQLTISEVAYQVGYQHPAHFTTAFRKRYGIVPSHVVPNGG